MSSTSPTRRTRARRDDPRGRAHARDRDARRQALRVLRQLRRDVPDLRRHRSDARRRSSARSTPTGMLVHDLSVDERHRVPQRVGCRLPGRRLHEPRDAGADRQVGADADAHEPLELDDDGRRPPHRAPRRGGLRRAPRVIESIRRDDAADRRVEDARLRLDPQHHGVRHEGVLHALPGRRARARRQRSDGTRSRSATTTPGIRRPTTRRATSSRARSASTSTSRATSCSSRTARAAS